MKKRMFENYPDVVGVSELCEMLSISRKLAYRLLDRQEIRCVRLGRVFRIPKAAVIDYLIGE